MKRQDAVGELIGQTRSDNVRVRGAAVRELCPCEVKYNDPRVWDRLIEMTDDPEPKVRSWVLHNLCDGSPREREPQVVSALEGMHNDPDRKIRRRVRKVLAHYRRTGKVNVL